jgi:hypothetical protein
MTQDRLRLWKYFAMAYAVLLLPFLVTFLWVAAETGRDYSFLDASLGFMWLSLWPVTIALLLVAIWYMGAAVAFIAWKYLEVVQFISGVPCGSRCGKAIVGDHFFAHAPPTSPYAWVHRKALAAYPPMTDDSANA